MTKLKLKIASFLNRHFPNRYCWTDCVAYAYSRTRWNPFKIEGAGGCISASKEEETCYCGQYLQRAVLAGYERTGEGGVPAGSGMF